MEPIKRTPSKNELAYEAIRAAILRNELRPGVRLVIDELATQLGVSPIPVREALRQLEADGFVVFEPYVGATVAPIEVGRIHEIFQLLSAVETISGRTACERITEEDIESLVAILEQMDDLQGDPETWSQENVHFHKALSRLAHTPLVSQMMDKVLNHWDRLRSAYLRDVFAVRIDKAQCQHWEMVDALRARDADRLESVIRQHNQDALRAYIHHLEKRLNREQIAENTEAEE